MEKVWFLTLCYILLELFFFIIIIFLLGGGRRGKRAGWRGEIESAFPALKFDSNSEETGGFQISLFLMVKNEAEMCIFRTLSQQILYRTSQEHKKEKDCYAVRFKTTKIPLTIVPSPHSPEISNLDNN